MILLFEGKRLFLGETFMTSDSISLTRDMVTDSSQPRRRFIQTVGATGLLGLAGCSQTSPGEETSSPAKTGGNSGDNNSDGTLTIGELNPLSGQAAVYGQPEHRGLVVGVNDLGTFEVNGKEYSFEVNSNDDQCKNSKGVNIMRRLVEQNKVKFIAGSLCSNVSQATASIVQNSQATQFINGSWSQEISYNNDQIFRNAYTGPQSEPAMLQIAKDRNAQSVILFGDKKHPSVVARWERLNELFPKEGIESEIVYFTRGQSDFSNEIQRISSTNPDLIYVGGYTADDYNFISQARDLGLEQVMLETSQPSASAVKEVVDDPSILEDVLPVMAPVTPATAELGYKPAQKFMEKVKSQFGSDVSNWHVGSAHYDMVHLLATAMQNAGTVDDYKAIREELYKVTIDEALSNTALGGPAQQYLSLKDGKIVDEKGQAWFNTLLQEFDGFELNVVKEIELQNVPAYPTDLTSE